MTVKISRDGTVSDSAAITATPETSGEPETAETGEDPGTGEPMTGIEHPADGTPSPEISSETDGADAATPDAVPAAEVPAPSPVVPPRRPARAAGE